MSHVTSTNFGKQLLTALGIESRSVTDVWLHCGVDSVPTVVVREFVRQESAEPLMAVLKKYQLSDKPVSEQSADAPVDDNGLIETSRLGSEWATYERPAAAGKE